MEAWYSAPHLRHHNMNPGSDSLNGPLTPRQSSQPLAPAEYAFVNSMSPPSSQRSSRSPPPLSTTQQPTADCHYSRDPELYSYFSNESPNMQLVSSSEEQLQYHRWEMSQLLGSSHEDAHYTSGFASTAHHSDPHHHEAYQVHMAAHDASQFDNDSMSGYASSSSPPSAHPQKHTPSKQHGHPQFVETYNVIHQVFKPMSGDFEENSTLGLPNAPRDRSHAISSPHYSAFLPMNQREAPSPIHARAGSKKITKENVKRFPCPDCGRRFARAFNMETHRKTHIGYRPHQCPRCHKNFSRRHDLHRHLAAVHDDHNKIPLAASKASTTRMLNVACV